MFFWKNRNKKHFTVRFPEESREVCTNPGRGWYHIYTFTLDKREKDGLLYQPYWDDETLVLVRFDIGAFRGMSLSEEALEYADEILKCFHSRGKEIILRVLYDTQGKGMEREPTLFSIVLTHMRQLGAVVRAYESDILITQGLFIGNWGENAWIKVFRSGIHPETLCCMEEGNWTRHQNRTQETVFLPYGSDK